MTREEREKREDFNMAIKNTREARRKAFMSTPPEELAILNWAPYTSCGLSSRTYNCVIRVPDYIRMKNGQLPVTVHDLCSITPATLLRLHGFGKVALREIQNALLADYPQLQTMPLFEALPCARIEKVTGAPPIIPGNPYQGNPYQGNPYQGNPYLGIAAHMLNTTIDELNPALVQSLNTVDDYCRTVGGRLRSRQVIAAIIFPMASLPS